MVEEWFVIALVERNVGIFLRRCPKFYRNFVAGESWYDIGLAEHL